MTFTDHEAAVIRNWIKRRKDKGISVNADEIWERIHKNWPNLGAVDRETIFQKAHVR